jgi:hypothetical protein
MHDPLGCRDDPFERLSGDSRRHGQQEDRGITRRYDWIAGLFPRTMAGIELTL